MPTRRNRRNYGYIRESAPEPTRPKKSARPPKKRPRKRKAPNFSAWKVVFLKILQLIGLFFVGVFRVLGFLWQRRPHLPDSARGYIREKLVRIIVLGTLACFLVGIVSVLWMSKDLPDPNHLTDREVEQSTKIYDRTGEHILYQIFADKKRTLVELDDIPKHLVNGVIATEDTKFYEHRGVRPLSILRALVFSFKNKRVAGTSTLTQQLVKNAILTNERRIARKIKEIILSIRLEQKYTKDQILKIYFNEIPYGSTNYGVEAASQSYFGKSVSELDLAESAVLAGMPKAPSRYLNNPEALKLRRDFVLERMFDEGYITREEADKAQASPVTLEEDLGDIKAEHFVVYVKKLLADEYGEKLVDTGGLKVITSLDWDKQQIAEKVIEEKGEEILEPANADNTALVALDPKTGHILSMIGSRDYYDKEIKGQFNVATLGRRQPGSSFKPIIYTAAFEKGYTPETVLFDVETNFAVSGKPYEPKNYDLSEHGPVTIRQALQGSLNIPAVKALYLVGEKQGVEFSEKIGYTTLSDGDFGLSLVLGGGGVSMLEHANAFAIFANGGKKTEPVPILKVEDAKGDVLFEWKQKRQEQVLEKEIAHTISNVLSDDAARAYAFGAGGVLTLPDRPVAAKTGTTNSYKDAWTVGYTPSLVTVVWAGRTDNKDMKRGYGGSKVAAPLWKAYMSEALKDSPIESFPPAPPNNADKPVLRGSQGGSITLLIDKVTGKRATSSTPERYIVERTYIQQHSILHYVQKHDPRGDAPANPGDDPQYQIWEDEIKDWIARKQEEDPEWEVSFEDPPTEYDDAHSLELIPSLNVVYPAPSTTITTRQIDTDIRVSAPRGVSKVIYRIDGSIADIVREHPFNLNYEAKRLKNGNHTLTIIVEDDIGNKIEEDIPFLFKVPGNRWERTRTEEPKVPTSTPSSTIATSTEE